MPVAMTTPAAVRRAPAPPAWLPRNAVHANAAARIFLLPPAGGNSLMFRGWDSAFAGSFDLCPIQLPGRGARMMEPPYRSLAPLIDGLAKALEPHLDKPYVLFGHSMGALVAFELARAFRERCLPKPALLAVSGARAPHVPEGRRDYLLPDEDFVAMLRRLDGTPAELLDNPEALSILLPILRADFEAIQTYEYAAAPPFDFPVHAFGGESDPSTAQAAIEPWAEQTTGPFVFSMLPGGHFFIEEERERFLALLAASVQRVIG